MRTITIAAKDKAFECAEDDTILRAALRSGLGFPYECNVGSCGNCRFELIEGEVEHLRADAPAWGERELARKRYLGCQARPLSDCTIKVRLADQYKSIHPPVRGQAVLIETLDINHDIREFRLKRAEPVAFLPGQYALLHLDGIDGGRAYSMSNTGDDPTEWHFQIRRVPNGHVTSHLFDRLKIGDTVGIDGPYGMAYLREDAPRDLICLAGGSGLSPMVAIARAAAASDRLSDRTVHFVYGGRTARDICGEDILKALPGYGERIHFHPAVSTIEGADGADGWSGRTGFVHDVARDIFGERLAEHEIYFAGPPAMSEALQRMLFEMKVPQDQIHFDQFY